MPRFVFPLDGVLRQRRQVERQRQRALAEAQAPMAACQTQMRAMDADIRAVESDLRDNRLRGRLDMAFIAAHRRYAFAMQRKALELGKAMAGIQRRIDQASAHLLEAVKGRKAIEKLRERHWQEWRDELARKERIELDEIGAQLYVQLPDSTEDQAGEDIDVDPEPSPAAQAIGPTGVTPW